MDPRVTRRLTKRVQTQEELERSQPPRPDVYIPPAKPRLDTSAGSRLTFKVGAEPIRHEAVPLSAGIKPMLTGQRVILVGNGPSSLELKEYIDRFQTVIRIQGFPYGETGKRWSIWAGCFGSAALSNIQDFGCWKHAPKVVWGGGGNLHKFTEAGLTAGRKCCLLPEAQRQAVLRVVPNPTSGFMSLAMAIFSQPAELVVVGFDATFKGKPGWDHWLSPRAREAVCWKMRTEMAHPSIRHDMNAEKVQIEKWFRTRTFCGIPFPKVRPRWWRLAEVGQPGELAGKRVCVVGNGPSAPQYAAEIDQCDVVVRCNAFPIGEAGTKWDAWYSAFMGHGRTYQDAHRMFAHPSRPGWVWGLQHLPAEACPFKPIRRSVLDSERVTEICAITDRESKVVRGHHPETGKKRPIQPTSGIFAIDLALSMQPAELVLVGFDAQAVNKPGWKHYGTKPAPWWPEKQSISGGKHDYELQHARTERWLQTREFYGAQYPVTKPIWWRMKP